MATQETFRGEPTNFFDQLEAFLDALNRQCANGTLTRLELNQPGSLEQSWSLFELLDCERVLFERFFERKLHFSGNQRPVALLKVFLEESLRCGTNEGIPIEGLPEHREPDTFWNEFELFLNQVDRGEIHPNERELIEPVVENLVVSDNLQVRDRI